jgi:transaldolase
MNPKAEDILFETVTGFGKLEGDEVHSSLVSAPLLAALRAAGSSHIYADTADLRELTELVCFARNKIVAEIDGNTANQPLVRRVLSAYLDEANVKGWAGALERHREIAAPTDMLPILYAIACARIGNDFLRAFASGRTWQVSLQLHMQLCGDPKLAVQVGAQLRSMVRSALVKVPFTPHYPHCFLVARDLENRQISVNFTSTFSARQTIAAALLSNVTTTNIFVGRLNQGLRADLLGEHTALQSQRAITALRRQGAAKTLLIVASLHRWQTFARTAGCDAYTAPVAVIRSFLEQSEIAAEDIGSALTRSYTDRLGIDAGTHAKMSDSKIAALYRTESEFIDFLLEYRETDEYCRMVDGDRLYKRFDSAGFGDLFYAPTKSEWNELRRSKTPNLETPLARRLPLDTLYSLSADADFAKSQEDMDAEIKDRLAS